MPSSIIKFENSSDIEILTIETTIRKNKILVPEIYKPPNLSKTDFTANLGTIISNLTNKREKLILMGDFNMATINSVLSKFLDTFTFSHLHIDPTFFKNSENPSCIDLLLTNFKPSFMKTNVFETGISDHHKMVSTIMKLHFTRKRPKAKYRKFDIDYFNSILSHQLDSTFCSFKENKDCEELNEFSRFHRVFLNLLNIQPPLKKNLRGNNSAFMTKTLRKEAIMIRSRLKNRFNKIRSDRNWSLYKTQRNFCAKLLRKTKEDYFAKLNPKLVSDNKSFWRTIKPYFSDKGNFFNKIMISEKDCIISDDRKLSEILNTHFINITKTLDLKPSIISTTKSLSEIIETFKDHPSIKKFFSLRREECQFKFHSISESKVRKIILNMNEKKVNLTGDTPAGILKGCVDSYISILTKILNTSLERGYFPNQLKLVEVIPVFKKEDELNKENYSPVSVLFHISKIFERIVFNQLNIFFQI